MKDQIITITTCPYARAQLIKARLEGEGIECFLSNINLIQPGIASGVRIKIKREDADKAYALIDEMNQLSGEEKRETVRKMRAIRRILVPVDFSETSKNACTFSLGLAQKLKAEIKLLHSYFNPIIATEPYFEGQTFGFMMHDVMDDVEKEARASVIKLKEELKEKAEQMGYPSPRISYSLDRGIPEQVIFKHIESYKPGLVVMGTQGTSEGSAHYFGSVTKKVIERADIPVLLIPEKSIFSGMRFVNRVLYATNFEESDFKSLRKLLTLIRPFNMQVYIAHISVKQSKELDQARMNTLSKHLEDEYSDFRITTDVVRHTDIIQGLEEYIENREIDLIALTTHKRGMIERLFNPSIARKMIFHSYVPLLIFHS
jgi:nucleotide-binding universal stress UspA family protein